MEKTKILHLIDSSGMYGAECVVLNLLSQLKGSNYRSILGCIRESEDQEVEVGKRAEAHGLEVEYFTMRRGLNLKGVRTILSFVRCADVKLIHSHGYKPNIFFGLLPKRLLSNPLVSTVHGWPKENGLKLRLYRYMDTVCLKRFDTVVAVSKAVLTDLKSKGIQSSKINLIYNGIDFTKIVSNTNSHKIRKELKLPEEAFIIGSIGRLSREKDHVSMLKAAKKVLKQVKNVIIILVGDGPLRGELEHMARNLAIDDKVTFLGYRNDIGDILQIMDIFVLPSLTEGMPISLLEAMGYGKPSVATDVGGIPEVIKNNVTGILVQPNNPDMLASAIVDLYRQVDKRLMMGSTAKHYVRNSFSSKIMAHNYLELYNQLLQVGSQ